MDKLYQLNTKENIEFQTKLRDELLEFGKNCTSKGGSSYYIGDDGKPWTQRPRETWITCRMAHVYSIGKMLAEKGCTSFSKINAEELAKAAIKGLNTELEDDTFGGWYAGIDSNGNKHDEKFWNDEEGLAVDTWDTDFRVLSDYRGLNANMHTLEAFLAVADTVLEEKYRIRAERIIDRVIDWAKNNKWRIPEHFTNDWSLDLECNKENPADKFKPYGATPGHGIEWARLIVQWAVSTYGSDIEKASLYITSAKKMYDTAINDAWGRNGKPGIAYTTDWNGNPVIKDRMHWTLAEAINTSAVLYNVTEDKKYSDDYAMFMEYLDKFVHDKVNGSWYHQLDENNELIGTVWPGKSDLYHAFQSTIIPYSKVSVSIAKAVLDNE